MRYALALEYEGTPFHGWQKQQTIVHTIQAYVEAAISTVADHPVDVVCAGRTDKGVHATHQVLHFDTESIRSDYGWRMGIQSHLPRSIRVKWLQPAPDDFHARYSATARRYRYFVQTGQPMPAILADQISWWPFPLDADAMHEAAQCLVGEHDFTSFRASFCQARSPFRYLHHIRVTQQSHAICIDIQGNAFLHHMVRNIAGCLFKIGQGLHPPTWLKTVLEAKDRRQGSVTAPPQGLYLVDVIYKDNTIFPQNLPGPWFLIGNTFAENPDERA